MAAAIMAAAHKSALTICIFAICFFTFHPSLCKPCPRKASLPTPISAYPLLRKTSRENNKTQTRSFGSVVVVADFWIAAFGVRLVPSGAEGQLQAAFFLPSSLCYRIPKIFTTNGVSDVTCGAIAWYAHKCTHALPVRSVKKDLISPGPKKVVTANITERTACAGES